MKPLLTLLLLFLTVTLTACGGSASAKEELITGDPVAGEALFMSACKSCHGPDAQGIAGRGKDLVRGDFIGGQSDQELVAFIKVGRPSNDPLNTTGVRMPAMENRRGLTEQGLYDIVAYIRTLRQE